jgi:putative ABC transport system permease protein
MRRRGEVDVRLDDEIRFHLDQQIEKNRRAGMVPEEARRQALIKFGALQNAKEGVRDEIRTPVVEVLWRDVRYAVRALRRAPGFTIAATVTLALGIGATTAMFSVVNGVVLRPLPYPDQERLVELVHSYRGVSAIAASPAVYFGYRDHSRVFDAVGLWDWDNSPVTVLGPGEPETVRSVEVTHEIPMMLGAQPVAGRSFTPADDLPGSAPTAMISYAYWQRRFGGGDAVGQTMTVDGVPREVIGVLPQRFQFFDYPADLFYPLQPLRATATFPSGDGRGFARLRKGVTLEQANADVARIIPILDAEYPGGDAQNAQFAPKLTWLKDRVVGDLADTLWVLMGTIALLLSMACANVANLVLVRTHARTPEFAVRSALGAGWTAIARVIWTESALLAVAGGIAGLALAYVGLPFLLALAASDLPQVMTVKIDLAVLLVTFGTSVLAACVCGMLPLLHFARPRVQLASALHGDGRATTEGRQSNRTRHILVVSQVAVALILLIGAGLMARAFQTLRSVDPGFRNPDTVQTFQLTLPSPPDGAQLDDAARRRMLQIQHDVAGRLSAIPGVEAAGFSSSNDGLPLDGDGRSGSIFIEGKAVSDSGPPAMELLLASPGFFETLQTPVLAGRTFDWNDEERRGVVLVSENVARAEWGSAGGALGKRLAMDAAGPWFEVVGVVKDMPQQSLTTTPPKTVVFPALARNATASFVIRSERAGSESFLADVRRALRAVNPALAPASVQTLGDMYRRSMARTSMMLLVLAITGTVALLLGLVGVYGIVSYAVGQRRREIGIRLALGEAQREVRLRFVKQALILVAVGVALGLASAMGLTRLMTSQLFGVSPLDAPTHVTVALILLVAAGLASFVSAYRAAALDPVEVLRS